MVVGFVSKRLFGRGAVSRDREGGELLASTVADFDLVTDWVFYAEIRGRNGTEDEVSSGLRAVQLASCVVGTLAWSVIASNGRVLDVLWSLVRTLAFFVVRPVLLLAAFLIPSFVFMVAKVMSSAILWATTYGCCGNNVILKCTRAGTETSEKWLKWWVDTFKRLAFRSMDPIRDRLEDGLNVSSGWVLLCGVLLEDVPQIIITFAIEDADGGNVSAVTRTAMLNLLLAGFDVLSKIAEAWDTRKEIITAGKGDYVKKIRHDVPLKTITVTNDGRLVAVADGEDGIVVWDDHDRKSERRISGNLGTVKAVEACGAACIMVASTEGTFAYDLSKEEPERRVLTNRTDVGTVAASPDSTLLAAGCADGGTRVYRTNPSNDSLNDRNENAVRVLGNDSGTAIVFCAFLAGNDALVTIAATRSSRATVWNLPEDDDDDDGNRSLRTTFPTHRRPVRALAAVDVDRFLTGSDDATVKLWDATATAGKSVRTYRRRGHSGPVRDVAVVDEGRRFLSAGADATIRLWEIRTGIQEHVFRGSALSVNALCRLGSGSGSSGGSSDGNNDSNPHSEFVSCSDDATIRFWSLEGLLPSDDEDEEGQTSDEEAALVRTDSTGNGGSD